MSYSIGVVCSVGVGSERGGRERNEDNYLICRDGAITYRDGDQERTEPGVGEGILLSVCDGMGGHTDGDVASTTAVRVMAKLYRPGAPRDAARALMRYILDSHRRLYWKARDQGPVRMGTTLTAVWLLAGNAVWAQVGDSRLYLHRNGKIRQLTPDHTRNEFAKRDGLPETAEGENLAQNFIYGSRGLGDNTALRMEYGLDTGFEALEQGDRLLICTDGLCGPVDEVSINEVLRNTPAPQAAAVSCMERAIARGSTDNITAVVVRVNELDAPEESDDEMWDDDEEVTYMF